MLDKVSLLSYMIQGYVHLSRKDYGFFHNIKRNIQDNQPITTNQTKLFDKLIYKYQRQLSKLGYDYETLIALPWKCQIIETRQEFLEGKIYIVGNQLHIKTPFNSNFIKYLKKEANKNFVWNREQRVYVGNYTTCNLKIGIDCVSKYYENVVYCDEIKQLLEDLEQYSACKYWTPTLVKINGKLLIAAINENLCEAIKFLELSEEPETLYKLSQYGIAISDTICQDEFSKFAGDFHATVDLDKLQTYAGYLGLLGVKNVLLAKDIVHNKQIVKELKDIFVSANINVLYPNDENKNSSNAVYIYLTKLISQFEPARIGMSKIIGLTNSRPVEVR